MSSRIPAEIPPEDNITLSPLDKYRIYGKFPYHMIIHIMLLIFNSLQAIIVFALCCAHHFTEYDSRWWPIERQHLFYLKLFLSYFY